MSVSFAGLYGRLVDLHLHSDGSISVPVARRLAEIAGTPLALSDAEVFDRLSVGDGCEDLGEYLDKFGFPLSLIQTREQISESIYLLQEELRERGYAYAELRFAPQSQCQCGLTQREVVEASLEGLRRSDFEARLILCCMRGTSNLDANLQTVELAAEYLGNEVVALDLAGAEALFPTADFAPVFARARELGVPFTIHAGEADGPRSVRDALAMGAVRIGHGVRAVEDPALVRELDEDFAAAAPAERERPPAGVVVRRNRRRHLEAGHRRHVVRGHVHGAASLRPAWRPDDAQGLLRPAD